MDELVVSHSIESCRKQNRRCNWPDHDYCPFTDPAGPCLIGLTKSLPQQAWVTYRGLEERIISWGVNSRGVNLENSLWVRRRVFFQNPRKVHFQFNPKLYLRYWIQITSFIDLISSIPYSQIPTFGKGCGWHVSWEVALKALLCDMDDSE